MKRFLSFVLIITLFFNFMIVASAETQKVELKGPIIASTTDELVLTLTTSVNYRGFSGEFVYDSSYLSIKSISCGIPDGVVSANNNKVLGYMNSIGQTMTGTIITVVFTVASGVEDSADLKVAFKGYFSSNGNDDYYELIYQSSHTKHTYKNGLCKCGEIDSNYVGWVYKDENWYYYNNGSKKVGWIKSNNKWYYMGSDGVMKTGWQKINGCWYYLNSGGDMASGWKKIDGKWYYLNPLNDSRMQTGWCKISDNWYYFNASGDMASGWKKIDEKWYYLNPLNDSRMQTGWCKISDNWYYFNANGDMASGWKKIDGKWYYLNPLNDSRMQTGWCKISDSWYFFNSSGVMVTGTQKIGTKTYYFDSNGVWIK